MNAAAATYFEPAWLGPRNALELPLQATFKTQFFRPETAPFCPIRPAPSALIFLGT